MLTAEQKAAKEAARKAKKAARAEAAKAATADNTKMALAMEGVIEEMDNRFEDTTEDMTELREGLKGAKADAEKALSLIRTRKGGDPTEGMDKDKFQIGKMAIAFQQGRVEDTTAGIGYELDAMVEASKGGKNLTRKDIISSLTGAGGGLPLPTSIKQTIVEAGRSQSVLFAMGAISDNMEGEAGFAVPYEVQADGSTAVTTGRNLTGVSIQEGGAIGEPGRPGFRLAMFAPKEMVLSVGVTQQYAKLGGQFVSDFVNRVAAKDMRTTIERLTLTGRGQQESEVMGLLNRSDFTSVDLFNPMDTNGRYLSPTDLKDFEMSLAEVDRLTDNCHFLTRPAVLRGFAHEAATQALAGAVESNSLPRTPMAYMSFDKMAEFMGYKMKRSTNVPKNYVQGSYQTASAILYGDFSHVWIPMWGPMEVEFTRIGTQGGISAWESNMIFTKFRQMWDANVVDPVGMICKKGWKTTG